MSRKHFAVGIDINSCSYCLLQQVFHIAEVMAGNQDARVFAHTGIYRGDFGMTIGGGVSFVKQCHCLDGDSTGFKHQCSQFVCRQLFGERRKPFYIKSIDIVIMIIEHCCMVCIGGKSLQTKKHKAFKRAQVFIFTQALKTDFKSFRKKILF